MGILAWLIVGLIAGALAKFIMPGKDPGGWVITIIIGIAGALVGGFASSQLLGIDVSGINLTTIGIAVAGALLLLIIYRVVRGMTAG